MNPDTAVARERLIDIFWADADPERARDSLKTALWSIRRCLRTAGVVADEQLVATRSTVRWSMHTVVDAVEFAELAAKDDSAANEKALQLYRGDFLEGDYDNWPVTERERLASLYEALLARVVRTAKDTEAAQRLIARNPYSEDAYAALIEAELSAGRRSMAAIWIDRCRNALQEVGDKPSAAFEARFGNIVLIEPHVVDELTLPFTGRENELALLTAKLTDGIAGHGSITLVHGEAGIGKSTLLTRAARVAAERELRVLAVRCADAVPSTFGPWQDLFTACGAGDFGTFVRSHASDPATAVAQVIAANLQQPTVLFVDDVHALTGEALDIFVALARTIINKHVLIAGSRPEGIPTLRSRLADVAFEELLIGCLDRSELKWALTHALGNESAEVLDVLYSRTSGHPLFFAGLLNSLVHTGTIARDGHRWQLARHIDADVELPDTVRRFIETRLRERGERAHNVACALALEPSADADDLSAVLRSDDSAIFDALDDLLALGLITQPSSGTQFAFTHDLVHDVAATALNAGRRAALHRAFARRFEGSSALEISLRLAGHQAAAGELLPAAESYLKSAHDALEWNAAQDAVERCELGISEAEKLERNAARDVLLSRLQRTAARALMIGGNPTGSVERAGNAVALARSSGDHRELTLTLLDLALMEGAASRVEEQRSDAAEASNLAGEWGDRALHAQALVQQASAARGLGLRDEALQSAQRAQSVALECGRHDIALTAVEELLRAQSTWWLFEDAVAAARAGLDVARHAEPLAEAAFLQSCSTLWYLLGRHEEAHAELQRATQLASATLARRQESLVAPMHHVAMLQFDCHYMAGVNAVARAQWGVALDAALKAAALTNVAKLPNQANALALLQIDVFLRRDAPADRDAAYDLTSRLQPSTLTQGLTGFSDCVELAAARVAARMRAPAAEALLRIALNIIEENAQRTPLEADRAFARLAEASAEISATAVANRARERRDYFRAKRVAAAGAAWGGKPLAGVTS